MGRRVRPEMPETLSNSRSPSRRRRCRRLEMKAKPSYSPWGSPTTTTHLEGLFRTGPVDFCHPRIARGAISVCGNPWLRKWNNGSRYDGRAVSGA
jgi:hypothetical protein